MMGLAVANGHGAAQRVVPWGGSEHRLSTNPISFAVPTPVSSHPIVVDMASSVTAEGKVRLARNKGKRLPEPWIVNANGELSTDPERSVWAATRFAVAPGWIRGLQRLCAVGDGRHSRPEASRPPAAAAVSQTRLGNGFYIQAVDIKKFIPEAEFAERMRRFAAHLKSSRLAPGFSHIMLPGDPEYDTMAARLRDGIAIDDETWRQFSERAVQLGVAV